MASVPLSLSQGLSQRLRFSWILSPGKDLVFYIGSALAGYLYVGIILYAIWALDDPLRDALGTLSLGGLAIPLNLELLVVLSWAVILDAPHVWGTLARTFFDPEEWKVRGRELRFSLVWFAFGPAVILGPYLLGAAAAALGYPVPRSVLALGAISFFVFFRLWAYYHVVRQHWGFFNLYKRKAGDQGELVNRVDYWFFNLSLYLPLAIFLTSPYYTEAPGFPDLGLHHPLVAGASIASLAYPLAWAVYLIAIPFYIGFQVKLWRDGVPLNGSKLLFMALLVPLHLVTFIHPILVLFVVPVVTVGHNLQYHCIVYTYAQRKYGPRTEPQFRWVKALFQSIPVYFLVGLAFTFAVYRGPWVEWFRNVMGLRLDEVLFNSIGMMAGIKNPAELQLGEQVLAAVIIGFALQHYYLDSKIWRVSRDQGLQKALKV